jgi:hypothetical protein
MQVSVCTERWHGTRGGYINHACRCPDCREANTLYHEQRRHRYWPAKTLTHGLASTYTNKRCRCPECSAAMRLMQAATRNLTPLAV